MEPILTLEQIKAAYPDQWVLLDDITSKGPTVLTGRFVAGSKNKYDLAEPLQKLNNSLSNSICTIIYTGILPSSPRLWQPITILSGVPPNRSSV